MTNSIQNSANDVEIYPCGTVVVPRGLNIECIITAISIRFGRITYEVSYFINNDYRAVLLDECEFSLVGESKKTKIGFSK